MSTPTPPSAGDLVPYEPQTWVDVPTGTQPPPGAVTEDAESFNHMEDGLTRAHRLALAAYLLLGDLPDDDDVAADIATALAPLTAALSDLETDVAGKAAASALQALADSTATALTGKASTSALTSAVAGLTTPEQATALAQSAAAVAVSAVIDGAPDAANTLRELKELLDANASGDAGTAAALAALVDVVAGKATPAQIASAVAGLAAVARTGSYTDLLNKPTIPAAPDLTPYVKKTDADATYQQVIGVPASGADDTSAIQAAINAAAGRLFKGAVVRLQHAADYRISAPLVLPANTGVTLEGAPGSRVVATAAMNAMITKTDGGQAFGINLRDLTMDGARLAQRCIDINQSTNTTVERADLRNATVTLAEFSRTGTLKVLGLRISNVQMRGVDGNLAGDDPSQMPAYGLRMGLLATDAIIENTTIINVLVGVQDNVGGGTVYNKVHVFGYPYLSATNPKDYLATKGFEITTTSGICRLTDCYADTQQIGFDLAGPGQNIVSNALFYWPADFQHTGDVVGFNLASPGNIITGAVIRLPSSSGLTGYPFQVQAAASSTVVTSCSVYGSGWKGMWNLVGGAAVPASAGNVWAGGTFPQALDMGGGVLLAGNGSGIAGAAGANRDLGFFTGTNRRWTVRGSSDAESGSNNGTALVVNAHKDDGTFLFGLVQVQRYNGLWSFQRAVHRLRASQTVAAAGAVTIDSALSNKHRILLQANVTSSTIGNTSSTGSTTIQTGQELSITLLQDATGGRTFAWPSTCRFQDGSPPTDTAANRRVTVHFEYDSDGLWHETGRTGSVQ